MKGPDISFCLPMPKSGRTWEKRLSFWKSFGTEEGRRIRPLLCHGFPSRFLLWVFYSGLVFWMHALCLIAVTLMWMAHTFMVRPLHYDMAPSFRLSYSLAARWLVMKSMNHILSRPFLRRLCPHSHQVIPHPTLRALPSHPNMRMRMNIQEWYIFSGRLHLEDRRTFMPLHLLEQGLGEHRFSLLGLDCDMIHGRSLRYTGL